MAPEVGVGLGALEEPAVGARTVAVGALARGDARAAVTFPLKVGRAQGAASGGLYMGSGPPRLFHRKARGMSSAP